MYSDLCDDIVHMYTHAATAILFLYYVKNREGEGGDH